MFSSVPIIPHGVGLECGSHRHLFWSCVTSSFSHSTPCLSSDSFHLFAGLPLFLLPATGMSAVFSTLDVALPTRPGIPERLFSSVPSTSTNCQTSFVFCYLSEMLIILIPVCTRRGSPYLFRALVSAPCLKTGQIIITLLLMFSLCGNLWSHVTSLVFLHFCQTAISFSSTAISEHPCSCITDSWCLNLIT